jgi:hypothetical protein
MMGREKLRDVEQLKADEVFPIGNHGYGTADTPQPYSKRLVAVEAVLCTLPTEPYAVFKAQKLRWFLPNHMTWGKVGLLPAGKVIYLSPFLECPDIPDQAVAGLVIHEIAHPILGHGNMQVTIEEDMRQEEEVYRAAVEWGFEEEIKAWEAFPK